MIKLLLAILPTVLLTIYGQIVTKWRVTKLFSDNTEQMTLKDRLIEYMTDPFIISAYGCGFLAAVAWLYVAERFPISTAFPVYTGVVFACVSLLGAFLLKESITPQLIIGLILILAGVTIISRVHG